MLRYVSRASLGAISVKIPYMILPPWKLPLRVVRANRVDGRSGGQTIFGYGQRKFFCSGTNGLHPDRLSAVRSSYVISFRSSYPAPTLTSSKEKHSMVSSFLVLMQDQILFPTKLPSPPPRNRNSRWRNCPFSLTVPSLLSKRRIGTQCWRPSSIDGWSVSWQSDGVNCELDHT